MAVRAIAPDRLAGAPEVAALLPGLRAALAEDVPGDSDTSKVLEAIGPAAAPLVPALLHRIARGKRFGGGHVDVVFQPAIVQTGAGGIAGLTAGLDSPDADLRSLILYMLMLVERPHLPDADAADEKAMRAALTAAVPVLRRVAANDRTRTCAAMPSGWREAMSGG